MWEEGLFLKIVWSYYCTFWACNLVCGLKIGELSPASATHLLDEVNGGLEIEPKVDELPVDPFLAILLLLLDEHVVVEELLQPLIGVVDTQLLKLVDREDLKASNVENANEEVLASLHGIEGLKAGGEERYTIYCYSITNLKGLPH